MTSEQGSLLLFQQYEATAAQFSAVHTALEGDNFVDSNVRAAYMAAERRLQDQLDAYRNQTEPLVAGAFAAGGLAVQAVDQLRGVQEVLPPDVLLGYAKPYEATLQRIATLFRLRDVSGDERIDEFSGALEFIGRVGKLAAEVAVEPVLAVSAERFTPDEDAGAVQQEDEARRAAGGADEGAASVAAGRVDEGASDELSAGLTDHEKRLTTALARIKELEPGEAFTVFPRIFWELAEGTPYEPYNRHALSVLTENVSAYRTASGEPVFEVIGRGGGTQYVVRGGPNIVAPSVEAPSDDDFLTVTDALTLASFFGMCEEAFHHKGLPAFDRGVLDALLQVDVPQPQGEVSEDDIRRSRAASFEKMWELANDPDRLATVLDSLPADDPRRSLVEYVRAMDGRLEEVRSFLEGYKVLSFAVTVRNRAGNEPDNVQGLFVDADGVIVSGPPPSARGNGDLLRAAEDERQEVAASQDPATMVRDVATLLAAQARKHGLQPGRPYMPTRLVGVFPRLADILPDTGSQSDTRSLEHVIVELIGAQQSELLAKFTRPEEALRAIQRGVVVAYTPLKTQDPLLRRQG